LGGSGSICFRSFGKFKLNQVRIATGWRRPARTTPAGIGTAQRACVNAGRINAGRDRLRDQLQLGCRQTRQRPRRCRARSPDRHQISSRANPAERSQRKKFNIVK
jgi:hypothetical protein